MLQNVQLALTKSTELAILYMTVILLSYNYTDTETYIWTWSMVKLSTKYNGLHSEKQLQRTLYIAE